MQLPGESNLPMEALWIGASRETLEQTLAISRSLFAFHRFVQTADLASSNLSTLTPGFPIVLEFEPDGRTIAWIENSHRTIRRILDTIEKPIILCVGHLVPAEVVVDWVREGAFSYVERMTDERHLRQAFESTAQESVRIQEQYSRYDKLLQRWSSITEREASVLNMLMEGLPNKKIANCLGVSQRTIEARRQKLYEKLESRSVVDVVRTIFELNSLEHVFHRIDAAHQSGSVWPPNASKFLQTLPRLQCDVPKVPFRNLNQVPAQSPSRKTESE